MNDTHPTWQELFQLMTDEQIGIIAGTFTQVDHDPEQCLACAAYDELIRRQERKQS